MVGLVAFFPFLPCLADLAVLLWDKRVVNSKILLGLVGSAITLPSFIAG